MSTYETGIASIKRQQFVLSCSKMSGICPHYVFVRNTMEDNWVVKCLFVINWMYQNIHVVHCSMSCLMRLQCIDLFNVQL